MSLISFSVMHIYLDFLLIIFLLLFLLLFNLKKNTVKAVKGTQIKNKKCSLVFVGKCLQVSKIGFLLDTNAMKREKRENKKEEN